MSSLDLTPPSTPNFCVVMLELASGETIPEPVFGSGGKEAMRYTLERARREVRDIKRAMSYAPNLAKPNSIVRVYLK